MVTPLPRLMVAPNGARRSKSDHPALPITESEIVETARLCQLAGADGIHVHIRDAEGLHQLDPGKYHAVLDQLESAVPGMYLQVTSESAGRYGSEEQRAMMRALKPSYVSVALREMVRSPEEWRDAQAFYEWALMNGVEVQHILYSPTEVSTFVDACLANKVPGSHHLIQLVQGSYANGSDDYVPLQQHLSALSRAENHSFDWMLCAFGKDETTNLVEAAKLGGKSRVGFENSLWNADGSLAADNAMRVREVNTALSAVVAG